MINGCSVITFLERTRTNNFCEFLDEVRNKNPYGTICLILDNYSVHKAKAVEVKANKMNIILVNLPKYSPDLNPIEYIWKSIKRIISRTFIRDLDHLKQIIVDAFKEYGCSLSFAKAWIAKFLGSKFGIKL